MSKDYSEYYERLTSYSELWAGDPTIYVKELVEAGFVYSGQSDIVFCFKCGATAGDWREEHVPIDRHAELNSSCPFLLRRTTNIHGGNHPPPPISLLECQKNEMLFVWVPGQGAVLRSNAGPSNAEQSNAEHSQIPERTQIP